MSIKVSHAPQLTQLQADATLSQASPTSGNKYEVLATTTNVRIIGIMASVTWTVQPTPLEIHVTIDGQSYTYAQPNPVSATKYYPYNFPGDAETAQLMGVWTAEFGMRAFLLDGRSVKVEAETTGGTVSNLSARVKYAKIP